MVVWTLDEKDFKEMIKVYKYDLKTRYHNKKANE